jgi:hypothetical protein
MGKSYQLSAVSFQQTWTAVALECGSLLPLFSRELARASLVQVPRFQCTASKLA